MEGRIEGGGNKDKTKVRLAGLTKFFFFFRWFVRPRRFALDKTNHQGKKKKKGTKAKKRKNLYIVCIVSTCDLNVPPYLFTVKEVDGEVCKVARYLEVS